METKPNNTSPKRKSLKKALLIGLGVAGTTAAGIFGYGWLKKRKNKTANTEEDIPVEKSYIPATTPVTSSTSSTWFKPATPEPKDEFPLKKGSKGKYVKAYQEKLIAKHGKTILPKYGADGDFGSEMEAALKKLGLPAEISVSAYNLIIKGAAPDANSLAKNLHKAAEDKNYTNALSYLKQIRNKDDYSSISEKFKEYRIDGGVRKTLVTGMLDTFKTTSQQDAIRNQFLRMGLKYDGSKWSLSGIPDRLLITTEPTELIDWKHKLKIKVPKGMVIGKLLQSKNGLTLFRTLEKNKKLIVKSTSVKNYERN